MLLLRMLFIVLFGTKNPHFDRCLTALQNVDIVEKLLTKQVFPDFYDISGTHSYQQIAVDTIL